MLATIKMALYRTFAPIRPITGISARWLELEALRTVLRERAIDLVLDVGANTGQFVRKLRRLGYRGRIISFEPDPRTYETLVARHGHDLLWRGVPFALGDTQTTATLNLARHSVLTSFLTHVGGAEYHEGTADVPVRRLDRLWDEIVPPGARVLLKTDTQGFDLPVFRGAAGVWDRLDALLVELAVEALYEGSIPFTAAIDEYRAAGFQLRDLAIVNRTEAGHVLEYDGLFVRG